MKVPDSKLREPSPDAPRRRWRRNMQFGFCFLILLWILNFELWVSAASPDDPESELASFKLAPGFEANLFASEQDGVIKPIQSRFDARGRLWVVGSTVYPQLEPGQVPNDKVLILEDRDGDGWAD